MTVKKALCISASMLPEKLAYSNFDTPVLATIPSNFFDIPTYLVDRAVCETDTATLQLLPYMVIMDENDRIFSYQRGKAGDEARLRGLSIGVGGHVDEEVNSSIGYSLQKLLISEARREVTEEVSVNPRYLNIDFTRLLIDPTNDVGRVHLGLLAVIHIDSSEHLGDLEKDIITEGKWLTIAELTAPGVYSRLENWSKLAITMLHGHQNYVPPFPEWASGGTVTGRSSSDTEQRANTPKTGKPGPRINIEYQAEILPATAIDPGDVLDPRLLCTDNESAALVQKVLNSPTIVEQVAIDRAERNMTVVVNTPVTGPMNEEARRLLVDQNALMAAGRPRQR
jgi:predicted NUDIX family phosphoesterase